MWTSSCVAKTAGARKFLPVHVQRGSSQFLSIRCQHLMNHPLLTRETITEYLTRGRCLGGESRRKRRLPGDRPPLLHHCLCPQSPSCRVPGFRGRLRATPDASGSERSWHGRNEPDDPGRWKCVSGRLGAPEWLAANSFFRTQYPDVETVVDLTSNAAREFFEKQGISIDYLHIDADHSFAGCYEDFSTFRHFLHEGSIVTLHDTELSGRRRQASGRTPASACRLRSAGHSGHRRRHSRGANR